jgi:2-amino-4-hydroxy-6-hydroxymethyldihydropteridine diphosphokinase
MEKVWLGIGSNLGDSEALIREAAARLSSFLAEIRVSSLWRSKARYVEDQPDFMNAVASGLTNLGPRELLAAANRVEAELGRDRSAVVAKGARTMDIDILLYGASIIAETDLIIPHPGIRERKFVLLPLMELDPEIVDPVSGRLFREFLAELPPQGIYPTRVGRYYSVYP